MQTVSDTLLAEIVQRLVHALQPLEIWLFGSHASGKTHENSDLDLLIVVADDAPRSLDLAKVGYPALSGTGVPTDLVFFPEREMRKWSPVRFSLPHEAVRKGRLLYAAATRTGAAMAGKSP